MRVTFLPRLLDAVAGQASVAAANFGIGFIFIIALSPSSFGVYAFVLVVTNFSLSVINAVAATPLLIQLNRTMAVDHDAQPAAYLASIVVSSAAAATVCSLVIFFGETVTAGVLSAAFTFAYSQRWMARSHALSLDRKSAARLSDITLSLTLLAAALFFLFEKVTTLSEAFFVHFVGAAAGWLVISGPSLVTNFSCFNIQSYRALKRSFRDYGRHSLLGVLATEATSNAHVYTVTAFLGAAAFAPIAVASMIFRPVPLAILAVTNYERPRMARAIRDGDAATYRASLNFFYKTMTAVWILTLVLAVLYIGFLVGSADFVEYSASELYIVSMFLALGTALRCARAPASALLQADGQLQTLSRIALVSAAITLVTIVPALAIWGAAFSLLAVIAGEFLAALLSIVALRKAFGGK